MKKVETSGQMLHCKKIETQEKLKDTFGYVK